MGPFLHNPALGEHHQPARALGVVVELSDPARCSAGSRRNIVEVASTHRTLGIT